MATTKNATYKRYNGTDWDTIYFATTYSQVGTNDNNFFMTSGHTINNKAWTKSSKNITLSGADIQYTGNTAKYITNGDTLDDTLANLDTAVQNAMSAIPAGVLTTSNYASTLNSVYQAKSDELAKISGFTASNTGWMMRTGAAAYSFYSTSSLVSTLASSGLVPTSRKVNGKALSSDVTLTGDDIKVDSEANSPAISTRLTQIAEIAEGKTNTFIIDPTVTANKAFEIKKTSATDYVDFSASEAASTTLTTTNGDTVKIIDLNPGDIILTTGSGIKDFFYAGIYLITNVTPNVSKYRFYQIDSDTPSLTGYATESYVTNEINKLDVDAAGGAGKYIQAISETDGKISATVASMPTSLPASDTTSTYSNTGTAPVNGKAVASAMANTAISAANTANGITVTIGGKVSNPTVSVSAAAGTVASNNTGVVNGNTVYQYVAKRATKVFYADTVPTSGMIEGDICIEY